MLRRFARDTLIYGAAAFVSRGITLLLIPVYTRVLRPADFGVVDMLAVFGSIVGFTIALEISQGVARYFLDSEREEDKRSYASTALWFSIAVYTLFVIGASAFAAPLSKLIFGASGWATVFRIGVVAIAINAVFYLLQAQLRWQLKPVAYAVASIAYVAVTAASSIYLLLALRAGVEAIFIGQIAGGLAGCALSVALSRPSYALTFNVSQWRQMIRFSLPFVPSSISVFLSVYVDRVCIRHFAGLADIGIYGIAFRFASVMGLLMMGFQGSLMPLVYQHHADHDTPAQLARIFRWFLVFALLAQLTLSMFAFEVVRLFTAPEYHSAALLIPFLAGASLLATMYIFAPGLAIAKQTGMIAVVNVGAGILNVVLNVALIPVWGLPGAAFATFASAAAGFAAHMVLSQRRYFVPHAWPRLGAATAIGAVCVASEPALRVWGGLSMPVVFKVVITLLGSIAVVILLAGRAELGRLGLPARVKAS